MEYSDIKILVNMMIRHASEQNSYLLSIQDRTNKSDFDKIRLMIAQSMGTIYADVLYPIFEEYPELKPAELKLEQG